MTVYKCKIATRDGKVIERVIVADSRAMVKKQVTQEGDLLVEARSKSTNGALPSLTRGGKVRLKEFYSFNQEFSVLLKAGVPVVSAFDGIIEKQESNRFVEVLKKIRADVSAGESVSGAFEKYQDIFSPLYIASLRAGETGGDIPGALAGYLKYMKRSQAIKQKLTAASVYPAILTVCSIFVVSFLLVFVVPAISGTFIAAGASLPKLTQIILGITAFMKSYYLLIIGFVVLGTAGFYLLRRSEGGRLLIDEFYLRLPILGDLSLCYATAMFASSLATVLRSGIMLNAAVKLASGLVENRFLQKRLTDTVHSLEQGDGFSQSLERVGVLPGMAVRMIAAGEEGGSLEFVLDNVAEFYETDVEARLTVITSSIEPMLMVLMGAVVGFIVLAMYMPIFQMAGTIG
jgi:type IV pilus assembly protein PilC